MIKHISLIAISLTGFTPAAIALTAVQAKECRTLSASLQVRQKEADAEVTQREELLARVEAAGDEWEAAETMRLFTPEQAIDADTKKTVYDDLKNDLMRREMALQSSVAMINSDIADYRSRCVRK